VGQTFFIYLGVLGHETPYVYAQSTFKEDLLVGLHIIFI
jgi:hypothetical protein